MKEKVEKANYICFDCGNFYGRMGNEPLCATTHTSNCDICGEEKTVLGVRHFGYLKKYLKSVK